MVRFRRDVGSLFSFIKASALLHQAQRQVDAQGRVVATVADYALAYPIFSKVMAQSSGKSVPDNVREVVKLIAERAGSAATKPTKGKFQRTGAAGPGLKSSSPASRSAPLRASANRPPIGPSSPPSIWVF